MIGPANLGPYHIARFREVVKIIPDFTYLRIFTKESYRPWSYDVKKIPCNIISLENNNYLKKILKEQKPNIIISVGYNSLNILKAVFWAKKHHIPVILQSDSTFEDKKRRKFKEVLKSIIIRNFFDAAFAAGKRSGEYVKLLGIPEDKIWYGVDVVDNDYFAKDDKKWRQPEAFPSQFFLTVSRLSHEKNLMRLLKAFEIYRNNRGNWGLVIVGTGPIEKELKEYISNKLDNFVFLYGWANYNELPSLYHSASCFILPSLSESWGLVVNEAMAAGLPILVSERCGCVPELCHEGVNGYSFDPFNVEQLAELMLKISSGSLDLKSMGEASKKIIADYTPEKWAKTVEKMCKMLLSNYD